MNAGVYIFCTHRFIRDSIESVFASVWRVIHCTFESQKNKKRK